MNKKILIIGRTGAGKDTIASILSRMSFVQLKSYATRPQRSENENTHEFITPIEVHQYRNDMIAYTKIGEYEYFATKEQLAKSDIYIIDPRGLEELVNKTSDEFEYIVLYVTSPSSLRIDRATKRGVDLISERSKTVKRDNDEREQFDDFESLLKEYGEYVWWDSDNHMHTVDVHVINNDSSFKNLEEKVFEFVNSLK